MALAGGIAHGDSGDDILRAEVRGTGYAELHGDAGRDYFQALAVFDDAAGRTRLWMETGETLNLRVRNEVGVIGFELSAQEVFAALDTNGDRLLDGADANTGTLGAVDRTLDGLLISLGEDEIELLGVSAIADWQFV